MTTKKYSDIIVEVNKTVDGIGTLVLLFSYSIAGLSDEAWVIIMKLINKKLKTFGLKVTFFLLPLQ